VAIDNEKRKEILQLIRDSIKSKIENYSKNSTMPFTEALLPNHKKEIDAGSFIHSLNTIIGQSFHEKIAEIITSDKNVVTQRQKKLGKLSTARRNKIENMLNEYRNKTRKPNKKKEIKEIISTSNGKKTEAIERRIVDFYMKRKNKEYFFEIKSPKANKGELATAKRAILEWVARENNSKILTYVAFPYNPYPREKYSGYLPGNIFDIKNDLMVGKDFWNFLGGDGTYEQLIRIYKTIGKEFQTELNNLLS